jgi:imidazolonepropionase-like amidohydrolase
MNEIVTSGARMDTLFWPEKPYLSEKVKAQQKNMVGDGGPNERIVAGPGGTLEARRHIIKALQDAGAGLLSGTDIIFGIPIFVLPGFSLHHELEALVRAGLTPYQALVTSTRNVAVFFGTQQETGTVAPGKRADLVLLSANPLENIRNTTRIAGVVVNGRWLSRDELDRRLASYVGGTP